ncbi:MAG: hypothetical protein FJ303_04975 [Planctomycetes bacterium]|nr:hypothetical protein [Planctomycetota bacterium]
MDFLSRHSPLALATTSGGKGSRSFLSLAGKKISLRVEDGVIVSTPKKNQNHSVSTLHFKDADIHSEFLLP